MRHAAAARLGSRYSNPPTPPKSYDVLRSTPSVSGQAPTVPTGRERLWSELKDGLGQLTKGQVGGFGTPPRNVKQVTAKQRHSQNKPFDQRRKDGKKNFTPLKSSQIAVLGQNWPKLENNLTTGKL